VQIAWKNIAATRQAFRAEKADFQKGAEVRKLQLDTREATLWSTSQALDARERGLQAREAEITRGVRQARMTSIREEIQATTSIPEAETKKQMYHASHLPAGPNFLGLRLFVVWHARQPLPLSARLWTSTCQEECCCRPTKHCSGYLESPHWVIRYYSSGPTPLPELASNRHRRMTLCP